MSTIPAWGGLGACAGADPDLFFPERGASTREAKAVCAGCPVRLECLEHALTHNERFGIWGGLSRRERERLTRARRARQRATQPAAERRVPHGTPSGYRNHGCRCTACSQANSTAQRRWREERAS